MDWSFPCRGSALHLPPHRLLERAIAATDAAAGNTPVQDAIAVWKELVLSYSALAPPDIPDVLVAHARALERHAKAVSSPLELCRDIQLCRVTYTHERSHIKVQIWASSRLDPVMDSLLPLLLHFGRDIKYGPPPRSQRERAVAKALACFRSASSQYPSQCMI